MKAMRTFSGWLAVLVVSFGIGIGDADAKRLGGGGSFGGKSAFGMPYKRSAAQPVRSPRQQQAAQQNQQARDALGRRGGLMGMLGGLALGGLLGALLFGGAFENFNFMDLLVFGGIAYLLYRLLAARAAQARPQPVRADARAAATAPARREALERTPVITPARTDSNDWFRGDAADTDGAPDPVARALVPPAEAHELPDGFDSTAFLAGARIAYRDLQKAWDARDHATLRALATPAMFAELQKRSEDLAADNRTDVLKLEAELLDARMVDGMLEAVVLFDAIVREDTQAQAQQVREVWHFTKDANATSPTWYLDGIQQLED